MGWLAPSIKIAGENITVTSGLSNNVIKVSEIEAVFSQQIGKVTYDEDFLILRSQQGKEVTAGELDVGFPELEGFLKKELASFPLGWRADLETKPQGVRYQIWQKAAAV